MAITTKSVAVRAIAEFSDFNLKMARGQKMLQRLKDEDVQIATADKEVVLRHDKVTLYHYKATAKPTLATPVLVAYGQIGRYTMTDLQEDRSMLRNLLALGVDVYAVDWGAPTRSDRWLRFEDYVDDYLDTCVDFIRRAHGLEAINLLGICEGGVFALAYAAKARALQMGGAGAEAKAAAARASELARAATPRERGHVEAVSLALGSDLPRANFGDEKLRAVRKT